MTHPIAGALQYALNLASTGAIITAVLNHVKTRGDARQMMLQLDELKRATDRDDHRDDDKFVEDKRKATEARADVMFVEMSRERDYWRTEAQQLRADKIAHDVAWQLVEMNCLQGIDRLRKLLDKRPEAENPNS
jgi:hypothetical protein